MTHRLSLPLSWRMPGQAMCAVMALVPSQATVAQVSSMNAMIPHHSIAMLSSERAAITGARMRTLADDIIET